MINFPKFPFSKAIFWLLVAFLAFRLLFSCTPIKRLQKFQRKYPYLFTAKTDTLRLHDTFNVVVPGIKADTFFDYEKMKDTVYMDRDKLHVKLVRIPGNKVYVSGKVDEVHKPVIRDLKIPYTKYEAVPIRKSYKWLLWFPILAFIGLIIWFVFPFLMRLRK